MTPNPRNATSANVLSISTARARASRGRSIALFVRRRSGRRARRGRRRRASTPSRRSGGSRHSRKRTRVQFVGSKPATATSAPRSTASSAASFSWAFSCVERRKGRDRRHLACGESRLLDVARQPRAPDDPDADLRPAERVRDPGEAAAGEEAVHRRRVVPDVERRVEVLPLRPVAAGGEIGLGPQTGQTVERRPLFGDAPLDVSHVVIGRKGEAVLHRQGGRIFGSSSGFIAGAPSRRA